MKAVTQEEVFGHSALIKTINDRFSASSEFFWGFFCPHADKTRGRLKVNGWRPQLCLLLSRLPLTAHHLDARLEEKKQSVVGEVGVLFFSLFFCVPLHLSVGVNHSEASPLRLRPPADVPFSRTIRPRLHLPSKPPSN